MCKVDRLDHVTDLQIKVKELSQLYYHMKSMIYFITIHCSNASGVS